MGTRLKATHFTFLLSLVAVALIVTSAVGAGGPSTPSARALGEAVLPGSDSMYKIRSIQFEYPYDDPRESVLPDESAAGVSFETHWTDSVFPGRAECELVAYGVDGGQVGTLPLVVVSGTDGARTGPIEMDVSSEPVSGEAECGQSSVPMDPRGEGYSFRGPLNLKPVTDPSTGEAVGRTDLVFDVTWATEGQDPGFRTCYLEVLRADGSQDEPWRFNVLVGSSESVALDVEGLPESITDATVSCGPFEP